MNKWMLLFGCVLLGLGTILYVVSTLEFPKCGLTREMAAKEDMNQIADALNVYILEMGAYPDVSQSNAPDASRYIEFLSRTMYLEPPGSGQFLTNFIWNDPWGYPYRIKVADTSKEREWMSRKFGNKLGFVVWSVGPNGLDERTQGDDLFVIRETKAEERIRTNRE